MIISEGFFPQFCFLDNFFSPKFMAQGSPKYPSSIPHQDSPMFLNSTCPLHQHVKESTLNKAEGGCCSALRKQLSEDTTGPVFPTEISVALKPVLWSSQVKRHIYRSQWLSAEYCQVTMMLHVFLGCKCILLRIF